MNEKPYYIQSHVGTDRVTVRQKRFVEQLAMGLEHPHDIVAVGFTLAQLQAKQERDYMKRFVDSIDFEFGGNNVS